MEAYFQHSSPSAPPPVRSWFALSVGPTCCHPHLKGPRKCSRSHRALPSLIPQQLGAKQLGAKQPSAKKQGAAKLAAISSSSTAWRYETGDLH